jgi:hypothetical protein
MQFSNDQQNMLNKVNEIGMGIDTLPKENIIYIVLSPYLDDLMALLKRLKPFEMDMLFFQYEGVMKVMRNWLIFILN